MWCRVFRQGQARRCDKATDLLGREARLKGGRQRVPRSNKRRIQPGQGCSYGVEHT